MTIRKQRNRPLRDSNYPKIPHGTEWPMSDKVALSSSDGNDGIERKSAKTKLLTSTTSNSSAAKSAKMFVNFNNIFVDGPLVDNKKTSATTTSTKLQSITTFVSNDKGGDGMSMNSDVDDNSYCPRRLSGGTHHYHNHHEIDKLILTPSQCKLKPAGLEFFDPKKQVNVINLQLNDKQKMKANVNCLTLLPQQQICRVKSKTRATQTLFRESGDSSESGAGDTRICDKNVRDAINVLDLPEERESSAQTLPYLPSVSNHPEELETLEIFKLPSILPGDGPPGLYEVEVLERARKRWSFAKALKQNFRKQLNEAKEQAKLQQPKYILEAFEWEHWIEREEYIQECQMLRLELLICMFDRREREMHEASKVRIQKSCEEIEAKRKAALKKNEIEYNRALRRLEIKHNKQSRVWRKEHITQELGDPSSEFYAPKMRYGVNPSRRHFTASKKGFDMRMDDLEKRAIKMDAKNLKCTFAKLKEWSKPKEVLQEVEQNFCSGENLKKLYESLRTLRESSRKQKYIPLCLKAKEPLKPILKEQESEEEFRQQMFQINIADEIFSKQKSFDTLSNFSSDRKISTEESKDNEAFEELRQQKQKERLNMEMLQKEMRCEELEALINSYEGNTIGWLMRFLTEEMSRLKEQRKLHFFTMIAKRERWHREAAEAGLRQKENCMREEYEKLYEECNQINKEMTDTFLNSILQTDIKDYAEQTAEQHVTSMARELDKEINSWLDSFNEVQNPLNYHALRHALKEIVMPDIEKILYCLERDDCIDYIINNVLLRKVYHSLESYDVSFDIASDFVDRLIDNDLYLNSAECSSDCECTGFCCCSRARQEAAGIIRKVIRYAVPGKRWLTAEERVAFENVRDLLDDIFDQVITKGSIIDVDMLKPPDVRDQRAHTDLACSKNDMIIKENSEGRISLEHSEEVKIKCLGTLCGSIVTDITKSLKCDEQLLLIDPDKLSADRFLLHKDEYIKAEPQFEPHNVHIVPSTHDISSVWTFKKTPIYAQTSSDELLERMQMEEEMMQTKSGSETMDEIKESLHTLDLEMSSSHEGFQEEAEEEEEKISINVSSESDDVLIIEPPKSHDKLVDQSVHFADTPEEKIFKEEPAYDEDDEGGVMEVLFSYDPNVKYSVPVPSSHDMLLSKEGKTELNEDNENGIEKN